VDSVYQDRRKFERFRMTFCVRSIDNATSADYDCLTSDISARGLGVISNRQLILGQCLSVWLTLPDNAEKIHTTGKVVWSTMVELQRYRAGIELDNQDLNPTVLGLRMLRLKLKLMY